MKTDVQSKDHLHCVRCKAEAMTDTNDATTYACSRCKARKRLWELSPADIKDHLMGRRHQDRYACYDCRFPRCKKCHERPLHAVSHTAWLDDEYTCIRCKYPPCKGCGKEAPSTKYRFVEWTCKDCKDKGPTDAATKTLGTSGEVLCLICEERPQRSGENGQKQNCCEGCAFPKCDPCGIQKQEHRYDNWKKGTLPKGEQPW